MVRKVREDLIESGGRVMRKKINNCYKLRKICREAKEKALRKWGNIYQEEREEQCRSYRRTTRKRKHG